MQYRFKYSGSTEGRKSSNNQYSNSQKNQILPYINILDKCTQILREDRIWVRNQLKAGDPEVISIFKQAKKPLNMQHLQIRLRKFVNAVKNKAKMEQLMKFKQNMNLGQWNKSKDHHTEKFNKSMHSRDMPISHQTQHSQLLPNKSIDNCPRSNQSTQCRNYKSRMNNSIDKPEKPAIYPYRNSSVNHSNSRKALQNYPVPMEEITERDSENITSARNRIRANQQNYSEGFAFGMTHSYNQWKRPENNSNPLQALRKQMADTTKEYKNINPAQYQRKPQFQEKEYQKKVIPEMDSPERDIYEHYNRESFKKNTHNFIDPYNFNSNAEKQQETQKFKNNFLDPEQNDNEQEYQYQHEHSNEHEHQKNDHINFFQKNSSDVPKQKQKNFEDQQEYRISHENSTSSHQYKDYQHQFSKDSQSNIHQSFQETYKSFSKGLQFSSNASKTQNIGSKDDTLFTSPELLMECRNFIKNKSSVKNSIEKKDAFAFSTNNNNVESEYKYAPLSFDYHEEQQKSEYSGSKVSETNYPQKKSNEKQMQDTMSNPFNNIHCGFSQSLKISEPPSHQKIQNDQETYHQNYQFSKKQPQQPEPEDFTKTYEFFQTFANQSSQKKDIHFVQQKIRTAEEFVDLILNAITDEAEGYVQWNKIIHLVQRRCPEFLTPFVEYLEPEQGDNHVLISNAGRVMEDLLQNEQQTENEVRNVYRLFDIERKGYINQQDLQDFVTQLEQAQAQDIDVIAQYLEKLFQSIDQDSQQSEQKRIDYWGIYARKNSKIFVQLNELLKQFQFQIE